MTGKSKVVRLRICPGISPGILVNEVSRQRTPIATSGLAFPPAAMLIFSRRISFQPPLPELAPRPPAVAADPKRREIHVGLLTSDDLGDQLAADWRKANA